MSDLFKDIIPSILQTKKNVLIEEQDIKDYKPFIVNRALSYHIDCVAYANEMNLNSNIDSDMQYNYLLNSIRPMKRKFQPWQKASFEKDFECIKKYFGYSNQKTKDILGILTNEQIEEIKIKMDKGGVKK